MPKRPSLYVGLGQPTLRPPRPIFLHGLLRGVFCFEVRPRSVRLSYRRAPEERDAFAAEPVFAEWAKISEQIEANVLAYRLGLFTDAVKSDG